MTEIERRLKQAEENENARQSTGKGTTSTQTGRSAASSSSGRSDTERRLRIAEAQSRQAAKSSTWWEDYKRSQRYEIANRQLEKNRSRDAAEDEIRELWRNPFLGDAEWQAGVLQRNADRYKRDLQLYQEAMQNAPTWGEYFSARRQAGESQSAVKNQFERYQQAAQKAEQERNESNLVNRPAQWQAENLSPQEIEQRLAYYRSEAATPTVTDRDREERAYLYPEAALQKDPHGARFDERLVEDAGQDAIDAAYRPILTEQEKAAVEEADQQIIKEKAERNYENVQRLLAAQAGQTEMFTRARGNELIEEIAQGGEAANKAKTGKEMFDQQQARIAADTAVEIKDDLESSRGAYTASQKERQRRGYILGYDWDNVPEDRKQAVYALYAEDPKKAIELAKFYISDVRQAEDEERQAWYAQSGWTAALGLVSSAAAHLGAAVDPFGEVGQELTRRGDNALAGGSQWADAATGYQKIPEWVPVVGGKGAGDLYQTVGSVVQSAAVAAPAILAGRYDQAGAEVLSKLGLALMGSSAAASDYRESVAAGMDEDRAKLHALAAGVEEALFEEVSLDKLIKMDTSGGLKAALKNWLVQSGIEGSEELATSIANRITDEMISGAGQSKVERRASELIANGMSSTEAHTQAESEWMTDTLYEGFSGFLSGGMMTGGDYALQGLANLKERAVSAVETRKAQKQAGAAVSRSEGSVEALQAYAKDNGIEIKAVETAEQNAGESAEQGNQDGKQNSYSSRDYRSISDTTSKVTQSIRNDLRGKTVQEQQAVRDSLVEKYGDGIAPVVNNAISIETAARVRQEYGDVDSIQAARNKSVSEIKDESLRRAVSDGYDSAAYSLAASQGGEGGMNAMSRYIQQRNNTGTGEMSMNATVTAQDGSTKQIAITGMSENGKRVSLADGSEVAVKDLQADADTTSAIQQLADLDLGADATKVLQAYQQSGISGTEGYRWLMDYATAYNQGRTRQISLEQAAQRSSLDERTVMDAYTLGQQAANRETQAGLEKLKNLPKRKGASGRTATIDTTEIKGKTMSKSELEQFELANQYAQALGVDMKWFSSKEKDGKFVGKNGAYENGKIYMDIHAGRNFAADLTSGILATMGHELSHFEQQYAPEEYQALKEFLFEQIVKSSPNGEARLERLIWLKQERSGYTLSRKAAEDEVVADACQKMLRDSKVVHDFASQQPEAANGVVRWLDKWFKRVRSIFGRGGNYSEEAQLMDSLEQDVKAAFGELWDKALKQATKVHDEVGNIDKPATEKAQNSDREDQSLRGLVSELEDQLDMAELNGLSQAEIRKLNNELIKARGQLDNYTTNQRRQAKKTSFNEILRNLENYERIDLESLAEQISDSAWDDYDELSNEELIDALRETINERLDDFAPGDADNPKYGLFVKKPKTAGNISVVRNSDRDTEYLEAVESNEDWKVEKMVRDAAVQWGAATDERGKPIPLYHGTPRFGFTVFKDPAHEVPFIYTSTNPTVSAHYAGDKNYAGRRPIGRKYRTGTKTEDIIENAKWVYESNFHVMSTEEKLKAYKEIEKQAIEIADKLDEVHIGAWNAESEAFKNMPDEVANAISWVEDMFWTIRDSDYKFNFDGKEDYPGERAEFFKVLDSDIENAKTQRAIVQEFYDENRKNLSKLEKAFLSYLLSYEVGDAAIDIEYKLRRVATENDVIMNEAGNINNPLDLKESMDMYHETGAYTLYGNLGDNPFIFDANGAQFWGVKVPEMGDGYYSTDSISKWAYENGYTGVVMKNIYDYGDKADNYVFFNSSQLKSADPVTYDDDGNVIPLSERFNKANEDIRFSMREPVEQTDRLIALHNLNATKLGKALDLGGFPMPSIAVTKTSIPHTNFGPITLVMDKSTIDPMQDRRNTVYSADAWTPTFPSVEYEVDNKAASRLRKKYFEIVEKYGNDAAKPLYPWANYAEDELNRKGGPEEILDRYRKDPDMMKLYLMDNGLTVPEAVREEKIERMDEATVKFYDTFVQEMGKDVFEELMVRKGETALDCKKRWFNEHGEAFEAAYRKYMQEMGFSDEEIRNVLDNETISSLTRQAVNIRNYLRNGAEKKTVETNVTATNDAIRAAVDGKKYDAWLHALFDGIVKSSGIYNGKDRYTPSGNERSFASTHYAVTLENIAKAMAAQNDGNSRNVDGFYGVKSLRAGMAKRFSSIAEMHQTEGRLQHLTEEQAQAITDALQDRLGDVTARIYNTVKHDKYDNYFIAADHIGNNLMEITEQKNITADSIKKTLSKYRYNIDNALAEDIRALLFDVSQMPVNIYEAKPERAVRFNEVLAAVVPSGTDGALVNRLHDAGVQNVIEYKAGDDADRMAKVNSVEGAQFSERDTEYLELAEDPEKNAARLQEMVDYAARKAGYTNRAYHGTSAEFTAFSKGKIGSVFHKDKDGFFFTTDQNGAKYYASASTWAARNGKAKVMDVVLKTKNPLIVESRIVSPVKYFDTHTEALIQKAKKGKRGVPYDSIIVTNDATSKYKFGNPDIERLYVVFEPEQIKSADPVTYDDAGNVIPLSERFNEANEDIRYSERDNAKPRSAQAQRDAGYKLSESKFYSLYSAHKLNMIGKGNVQEQISSIMADGFKGDGGFGNNVMPTNISYDVDENGKRIPRGLSAQKYAPKKGEYILLVPKEGVEVKGGRYNFTERVKPGYKPAFDYEIVQADYDGQPYYEMYEKAYDKSQAEKADVTLDGAQFSDRDELASDNRVHDITNRSGDTVGIQDGNGHLQFSQRTWRESGKEKMQEYLDERVRKYEANRNDPEGMHPDDAKALMDAVQEQYDALDEIVRQQPGNYKTYEEWADAEVETDIFGNPVFSWLKANGDYGISGDASLICVKRRTLDAVFDYMIRENMIQDGPEGLKLAQESIVAINDIIRAHGFETACSTCYIDARRYRAAIVAGSFCNVYNKLVRSMLKGKTGVPINAFNFGGNKSVTPLANSLDTLPDSEINWDGINKAIRDQEAKWESKGWEKFTEDGEEKWRRNGTVKNLPTSGTTEYRIALALKEKPSLRKLALRSDFLSGNGFLELNRTNKDILTLYNVKKGQAGPKATETDIQYLHEALENSFITPDRMFKAGGFRLQSFSDYVPRLVFDYVEIIGDLSAKGVPAHMYTKEILCVLQHGLTGTKINMSLIPAMVKKGFAPGLDADGNYLWRDGQTFGSTAYSLSPKLEAHLSKILGYQVKGRLTGAQGFELAKLIQNDPAYGKNNGTIAIGVSEAQIRKMLDDADIRMVIPYHKSGLNHILASMMEIPGFENYESYQNTLKWNGTKWSKVDVDFDFNEAVQKHKGDARAAAQDYLDWCNENGYKPKFSGVASGSARNSYNKAYDFTQHADWQTGTMTGEAESNYYKVLADFTCYDAEGKVSRQEAVKLNYPGTDSAFGSMKQLIEMGLESDAMLQAKQDAEVPKIVADIVREIPKFEAAGRNMKAYAQLKENVEGRQYSERDYSTPSDEELLMNARVEDAANVEQGRLLEEYQALGQRIATLEKQLAEARLQTQLTNRALNTRGIGNVVKTVMRDYDITDARHNGTAKNATLALTEGYQKALDLLDKGASPAEVNDAVYNGAVQAAEIILEQGTYSQNLGGKWQTYSASRYLGESRQELIDSFVSEAYADFVSNRYREARPETVADRLVARTKKEAQERVDKYKGRSDALAEANRRLEEKKTQAETEAKEARKAAGELFLEIKDLRQELMDNKTMSEQERKAASKKLKSLNTRLESKQKEAANWQKRAKRNASLLKSALESKNRDISALNNRLSKEQAAALEKQKSLEAKLEKQIQRERDILAGKLRAPELVKMLKAEREKAEARVKEQKEQAFQNYKERKKAGELRRRIVRHSKELYGKLTKPSDKRHIPEAYRGAVAALLNTINLESAYDIQEGTKNESGRGGKHVEKGTGTATNRTKAFQEVRKQLEKVLAEGGFTGELINNAAEGFDGGLIEKCQDFADKPISTLSSEELETLWNTIRALEHNIATFNKAFALAKTETISGIADKFLASAQKRKPLLRDPKSRLDLTVKKTSGIAMKALENPYTFFSHYGEEGVKLFRALRDTQDLAIVRTYHLADLWVSKMTDILGDEKTANLNGDKLTDAILDKIRDTSKQMDEKVETFKLENGQTITLTHAMLMDVYLLSQRGEVGMNHLLGSGLIQPEIRAKGKYVARDPSFRKLSLQDVQKMTEVITENATEKAIADAIQSMQHQLADWGNEASMDVFGYRKFTEDNYWPVKNAKEENKSDSGKGGNQPANAMNKGMAKNLVPHAATGMEPMSAFTKLQGSISDMLVYATWGPVMEDFKRFYNWKWLNPEGGTSDTVKGVMERYGGEGSQRYWEELRDQINNGVGGGKSFVDQFIGKAVGVVKGARVAFNLRVVAQQPTAYARAAEVISGKYLAASLLDIKSWGWKAKSAWNRALTHSPIAMRKDSTTYDMGGNISAGGEFGLDRPGRLDKARDFGTALAGKADAITWGRLWHAAELQVSAKTELEYGSQEYWDAVNKLFTDAVDRTQVVDGLLQRPAIMRTDSDFVKGATSYMGEPLMQLNMLMRQVNDFRQTGFKATKKQIGKTVTALVVTQLINAMLTGLYDAGIRKDDKDKDFWERFMAEITGLDGTEENAWDYITSVWLESNVASEVSVMQKIPLVKDVLSMLQGYDPSNNRMDLEAIKDLIDVCTKVLWNDNYTPLYKAKEMINKASMIFGAGFGNALKDMYGVTRNIINDFGKPQARFDFKALWLNPASKKNKSQYFDLLFQMLENGDKDAFRQRAKKLAGQDGMLQYVAKAAIERYLTDGLSPADVWDMMEAARDDGMSDEKFYDYAHGRMADAIKKSYLNRKLEDDQAITLLMKYAGKDEQTAWKKVQEWADKAEHTDEEGELEDGYKYSAYTELFDAVDANQNADGVIQTMVQNGGYDTDSLRGKIKEHLLERFIAGQITETALKNQLSRYCKISKADDANEIVANAKCKRDFGVYPDALKEAFKDGDLSQNQAVKALQQYNGLSKTDAQNRVHYWGYDGDLSENAWLKWNSELKKSGLSVENWEKVYKVKSSAKGTDANGDGRADSGTVKAEVVAYIDSMNIPKSQKKAIYLAFGWAASTMPSWR